MLNKIKKQLSIALAGIFLSFSFATAMVGAQAPDIQNSVCKGSDLQFASGTTCSDIEESETEVDSLIATVINIFSVVVGIIAVIMIVYGGFRYITSGGDSAKVTSARNTILYAIVGLIIVALAQFIVKFVLSKATNT